MKIKRIIMGDEARLKAKEGIDLVADIVKTTLGPKGRNCLLKTLGPVPPRIVNDGVTIAREIKSEDCFVNAGAEMTHEICFKTNENAGDGTTTTAILAQAITSEAQKRLIAGENPIDIKNELNAELENVLENLKTMSKNVSCNSELKGIATIASNNDDDVGEKIAEVFDKVGRNASILVEKSNESKITVEIVKGVYFDKGWRAPAFVNTQNMKAVLKDALVCVTDKKLNWVDDVDVFFRKVADQGLDKIVVIADEIEGEALATLCVTNKEILNGRSGLHILGIEAPEFGPTREELLEDICIMTGATLISDKTGFDFQSADPTDVLGGCEKIVSDSKTTTIVGGNGDKNNIKKRINDIKAQIDQLGVTEKVTKEKFEKRLSILESGVGIIHAGGVTEIETRDRNLRIEDAILATKSAIKSGYVAGGGYTYLKLAELTKSSILKEAFKSIMKQVALNAGKNPDTIIEKAINDDCGWDARNDVFGDLIKMRVIDSTLVLENSIKNAISLASLFITMENQIVETEKEVKND